VQPERLRARDGLLIVWVLMVATTMRAGYLLACADGSQPPPLAVQDAQTAITLNRAAATSPNERDLLVENLRDYHSFGGPAPLADLPEKTAHISPGYPWLIATVADLQDDADATIRTVRWVQCGLGVFTAGLYFLFARLLFGSSFVAFLAGLLTAIHPFWIVNTSEIQDGILATFLLACCLFLGAVASQRGRPAASLAFGISLAGLALVRAALLPFAFVACLWFLLRCRTVSRGWLCALLAFLGFANGLTPWLVRNFNTFGEVVPITDTFWLDLWIGNNSRADGGPQDRQTLKASLSAQRLRALSSESNQPRRYGELAEDVLDSIVTEPAATVEKRMRSGICFVFGQAWLKDGRLSRATASLPDWLADWLPLAMQLSLAVVLVLGVLGWRWSYGWQRRTNLAALALLWVPLPYILGHAEHFAGPRLPVDGVLLCFAAFALAWMLPPVARVVFSGNR
jgi:4-amino-4-deoxy-L-arabinose transferase-like glycosyltransferase